MGKKNKGYRTDVGKSAKELGDLGGGNYFKPKSGKNTVRILPPWNDSGIFFFKAILHYGIREEGGPVPCGKMVGKSCPICEALAGAGKKMAKKSGPRIRFYVNVIDRKNPDDGIKIWGMTPRNMKKIKSAMEDPDYGDITDPDEGRDIIIELDDSKKGAPQYEIRPRVKTSAIEVEDWEENLNALDEVVVTDFPSKKEYKELVAEAFNLEDEEDDEDEDEEEKPKKKAKKDKKKNKKAKDEEDEEESDDDDDEEEDEKPKKKGKKSKKKDDEDEDDDDED